MDSNAFFHNKLISLSINYGAFKANIINVDEIKFDLNFRKMCECNYCGMYNKCYMCPPSAGTVDKLISKAKEYKYALVFQTVTKLEDSYDFEEMLVAKKSINYIISKIKKVFKEKKIKNVLFLGPGGCGVCDKCAKQTNEPCRYPEDAIHSLEAYCINVNKLATAANMKYINGQDTVTYFAAVLF